MLFVERLAWLMPKRNTNHSTVTRPQTGAAIIVRAMLQQPPVQSEFNPPNVGKPPPRDTRCSEPQEMSQKTCQTKHNDWEAFWGQGWKESSKTGMGGHMTQCVQQMIIGCHRRTKRSYPHWMQLQTPASFTRQSIFCFGPDQDEPAWPAQYMVLKRTSGNQGSESIPSISTMIRRMIVVADLIRSED